MQCPTDLDLKQLKHIGRYLRGRPRAALRYVDQEEGLPCTALGDWDFGGCLVTRRSTNGGIALDGRNTLVAWSTTQSVLSMSTGESELYGCVKTSRLAPRGWP